VSHSVDLTLSHKLLESIWWEH